MSPVSNRCASGAGADGAVRTADEPVNVLTAGVALARNLQREASARACTASCAIAAGNSATLRIT